MYPPRTLLLCLAAALAQAQSSGSAASSATPSATTTDVPLALWSAANSLLTSYYPSTSITQVASLSWPSSVVIGGTTYNAQSLSEATASATSSEVSSSATPSSGASNEEAVQPHKDKISDQKLGIIIGVVVGFVVLVLLGVIFFCLKRRKDDTGSFFMRRGGTPSRTSSARTTSTGRSWLPGGRSATYGNTTYVSAGANDEFEKQPQMTVRPAMAAPRMSQHPAFARKPVPISSNVVNNNAGDSSSEENPFYTPAERMDAQLGHSSDLADMERGPYDPHPVELDMDGRPLRQSSSIHSFRNDRPPTPFSPMAMMGFGAGNSGPSQSQSSHIDRRDFVPPPVQTNPAQHQPLVTTNPFSSSEDEEDDVVSPILPSKHPERRHSPMVHYPSWSEVSEFDFRGDGRQSRLQNMSSSETDGGDGWKPIRDRERHDGRYELA